MFDGMPEIEIAGCEHADKAWDRFVEGRAHATVAHLGAWREIVERAYGHETFGLAAREDGEVVGVLPLVLIRSRLFGRRLVSMPFLDYGGILADPGSGAESALLSAALDLGRELGAASLGLRHLHPTGIPAAGGGDRVTMILDLPDEDAVWRALSSERRNRIRKGERNGLTSTWGGAELLADFYAVFAANMRDLGSPVHARRFFEEMLRALPDVARVLVVRDAAGRAVGAAVCLFFRDSVMVPWVSSRRDALALCPNFVLYWEAIRAACREGARTLDLGRSFRSAGTFEFKRQWGARPHPLSWVSTDLVPGASPPVDRDTSRFRRAIDAWKLLPLPVATLIGPWLRGQIPN
jgi:FemAB-related protein (PEP-CTERM system-associated)